MTNLIKNYGLCLETERSRKFLKNMIWERAKQTQINDFLKNVAKCFKTSLNSGGTYYFSGYSEKN